VKLVVTRLIEMGCSDTKEGDALGYSPHLSAARTRHEEEVKELLGWEEVDPENC